MNDTPHGKSRVREEEKGTAPTRCGHQPRDLVDKPTKPGNTHGYQQDIRDDADENNESRMLTQHALAQHKHVLCT